MAGTNCTNTCTGGATTNLAPQGGGTYTASCTVTNLHNVTFTVTASVGGDTYYLPADVTMSVKG